MEETTSLTDWQVGRSHNAQAEPESFIPAQVPGAVQLDWAAAHQWPPYYWDCEANRYRDLEDAHWHYRAVIPPLPEGKHHQLRLRGVDHQATVRLDGDVVGEGIGTAGDIVCAITPSAQSRQLRVIVQPAPKVPNTLGRDQARESTKAAVSYGWDFHPELVPLGLADEVTLESLDPLHLTQLRWRDRVSEAAEAVSFTLTVGVSQPTEVTAQLIAPNGSVAWEAREHVNEQASLRGALANPELWWPQGHGPQSRYRLVVTMAEGAAAGQRLERQVGFKRARLLMAPGQWNEPAAFPKARSLPPMLLEINGRQIFGKGANLVGPDIFPGTVTDQRWKRLVERAANANMNVLRIWGGSRAPADAFFEACDAAGIMVIQEFPLACNAYPDKPAYLAELEDAAKCLLDRLAGRPCRILWSGGNELFNAWSGMTDQSHALRLLASLAWNEDPDTPFLPTLPVEGIGHGYYLFRDPAIGVEVFELFQKANNTAYTEFGVPAAASVERIRELVPADQLWPPQAEGAWKLHSGMEAWDVEPTSYMCLSTIEHYWGPQPSLEALVAKSQWLQCEGHKGIIEEARRQHPTCNWAILWCLNEPWPTVANQCLLAYPDQPKPSLDAVTLAMRPTLASARIPKFSWEAGELFEAELWLLHDAPGNRPETKIEVTLRLGDWAKTILVWQAEAGSPNENLPGPAIRYRLPKVEADHLEIALVADSAEFSSAYRLVYRTPGANAEETLGPRGLNA